MSALDEAKRVLAHPLHKHLANYLVPALAGLVAECAEMAELIDGCGSCCRCWPRSEPKKKQPPG